MLLSELLSDYLGRVTWVNNQFVFTLLLPQIHVNIYKWFRPHRAGRILVAELKGESLGLPFGGLGLLIASIGRRHD